MICINLKKNLYPSYNDIQQLLLSADYNRCTIVLEEGDFAIRGHIIDIFPYKSENPVRLEYELNTVQRLQEFSIQTQLSIQNLSSINIKSNIKHIKTFDLAQKVTDKHVISNMFAGDYIIHEDYGLGIFEGLKKKTFSSCKGEYICIRYTNKDHVYIPLDHLNKIHPYSKKEGISPKLNSLTNEKWNHQKLKAKVDTLKLAEDLFETHKKRQEIKGFSCKEDSELQLIIENEFPYKLTLDQEKSTQDIKQDMESRKPMERLLCGDVGFGKTECIVRATLKALENDKQVAILAPTTILVEQHFETFSNRLKNTPYIINYLSRSKSKVEQQKIINDIKMHRCDCIIGTHKLLSKELKFANLGLFVIDEEQRFGVQQKEIIKAENSTVDTLYVSATPIPRTLYMSLSNAKDLSVIETAPPGRKPILTSVEPINETVIKKAFENEIKRKGQLFYIFNSIKDIHKKAKFLKQLQPELRLGIIHGRMSESKVNETILAFKNNEFDCLLSTTLIENGIDISNAHSIIIDGAENFGLSQIHQLRGRVGRSKKQSYAYLLYNNKKDISEKAKKRLQAIKEYMSLGSGYDIALRDLEIRGAGALLGKEQHGHIISVGFSFYCKLLEESVNEKKGIDRQQHWLNCDTQFITIPETYIENPRERLSFYRKFMTCESITELKTIQDELSDRYGRLNKDMLSIINYIKSKLQE
ncbi:transcription-repair coupling factor [Candidatus Marinamargulisbacteria bacterium SCGC AG-343-D04]|nr:transcription-repair coupling factor [Candidatus Marinamargulisbacteria bacterium SCGC AG-343-D04]